MSDDAETAAVRALGDAIGYGRTMQLCEQIWDAKHPGAAHSHYCCTTFLVPCECDDGGSASHCTWCCGAGRVTMRVRMAQRREAGEACAKGEP